MKIIHLQNSKNEVKIGNWGGEPASKPDFALGVPLNSGDHETAVEGDWT